MMEKQMSALGVRLGGAGVLSKWLLGLASAAAVLTGCGGDGAVGVGGSGAPPVGFAEGTVTSLSVSVAAGSTYDLDGAGFDTSNATVQAEQGPFGDIATAEIKLGQHIEIDFEVDRVAKAVRVEAQAVGRVSAVGTDVFAVLGQRVHINTNPNIGPVTVFDGGYVSLADVQVGQVVEVHGLTRRDPDGVFALQATRVEWRLASPAYARLSGVVSNLSPADSGTQRTFCIGGQFITVPAGTPLEADLRDLQNGWTVVVFGTLGTDSAGRSVLQADQVKIKRRINFGVEAYFGGTLTQLDAVAKTFELNGVPVRFGSAVYNGPAPAEGQYLQMRGNFAVDGSFDATIVTVRSVAEDSLDIEGTITAASSATRVMTVQGYDIYVPVGIEIRDCVYGLTAGIFVEVDARIQTAGIVAERVRCR
jgi:hypothetical protein